MQKKRNLTRKQQALRRSLFVVCLILVYITLVDYQFTTRSAMQKAARRCAINPVELLVEQQEDSGARILLSRNEDAILFLRLTFSPFQGWTGDNSCAPLPQYRYGAALLNTYTIHTSESGTHIATYFYGFLPKEATSLELVSRPADDPPQAGPGGTLTFSQKDFLWDAKADRWFFLVESPYDGSAFVTTANVWDRTLLLEENVRVTLSTSSTTYP